MYEDRTSAEVIADTIYDGVRLTSMRVTMPNVIHKHVLRHRLFSEEDGDTDASFSFESQRAAPVKKHTNNTEAGPFEPLTWRANGPGMSPRDVLDEETSEWMREKHYRILNFLAGEVREMEARGLHKEQANRYLEPFTWTTAVISATSWDNFFALRDHEDAQAEVQILAKAMRKALKESTPNESHWHIPFHNSNGSEGFGTFHVESACVRAVARCARVSYGREMEEKPYEEDVKLVERLLKAGHASPFEHIGFINQDWYGPGDHIGNFQYPWLQLRHHTKELLPAIAAKVDSENY